MELVKSFEEVRRVAEEVIVGDIFVEVNKGVAKSYAIIIAQDVDGFSHAYNITEIPANLIHNYRIPTDCTLTFMQLPLGFIAYLAEKDSSIGVWAKKQIVG